MRISKKPWQRLTRKTVYQNSWITVVEDTFIRPNGESGLYAILKTNGPSVFIIAQNQAEEIYLVHLFRYPTQEWSWELPAGSSDNQDPLKAAQRELLEETGLTAHYWHEIGRSKSMNGVADETSIAYVARELSGQLKTSEPEEGINAVKAVSIGKLKNMIANNEITDGQSLAALTYFFLHRG